MIGAVGYYSALVIWIIAQRTHHLHGKYSHSWMIGALLLILGTMQVIGSLSSLTVLTGLFALVMPVIVTTIDVDGHRREGRGLLEHKPHCWMQEKTTISSEFDNDELIQSASTRKENWSSR